MQDSHRWMNEEGGQPMLIRDMPSQAIAEHLFDGFRIISNDLGLDDPIFWVRLRLEVELVRRQLGLEIR